MKFYKRKFFWFILFFMTILAPYGVNANDVLGLDFMTWQEQVSELKPSDQAGTDKVQHSLVAYLQYYFLRQRGFSEKISSLTTLGAGIVVEFVEPWSETRGISTFDLVANFIGLNLAWITEKQPDNWKIRFYEDCQGPKREYDPISIEISRRLGSWSWVNADIWLSLSFENHNIDLAKFKYHKFWR